ncbi:MULTISPECIES: hypothetical protein [unclassified Colwellia]|nr:MULTISPECIES: hypothetical protein [unclassified Colwellia]
MLINLKTLSGSSIHALDLDDKKDLMWDTYNWSLRCLVVDTRD